MLFVVLWYDKSCLLVYPINPFFFFFSTAWMSFRLQRSPLNEGENNAEIMGRILNDTFPFNIEKYVN